MVSLNPAWVNKVDIKAMPTLIPEGTVNYRPAIRIRPLNDIDAGEMPDPFIISVLS
jgi:hypothetical protein